MHFQHEWGVLLRDIVAKFLVVCDTIRGSHWIPMLTAVRTWSAEKLQEWYRLIHQVQLDVSAPYNFITLSG